MAGKRITIRHSLVRNLVLLILITSGAILAATLIAGLRAVKGLSKARIERTADRTEKELEQFFGSVRREVMVGRDWAEAGLLDPTDHMGLNRLFVPVLSRSPHLSSMMVADTNGAEYLLLRDPLAKDAWMNRVTRADEWGPRVLKRRWNTSTGAMDEAFADLDYDPRRRIWFQGALETGEGNEVHWTKPVIFFTTKDPGITAGTHVRFEGGPTQVVAYDLLLMDISHFTTRMEVSERGIVFVLAENPVTHELRVIGLPRSERFADDAALRAALVFVPPEKAVADTQADLPLADTFVVPELAAAVAKWNATSRASDTVQFDTADDAWWAGFRPYRLDGNILWIGVAVPEGDFLGDLVARSLRTGLIALLALAVAVFMAFRLARAYGKPLEDLAKASHRIRDLDLEGESNATSKVAELDDLAEAQRQMVSALRSFSRYVPVDVVRELVRRGEVAQIGGRTVELTVLFTDIAGFTRISEGMTPEALTSHMAEYFEAMIGALQRNGATVDKLVGDAIVAFWGAPQPLENHTERAVESVLECQRELDRLNERWQSEGRPALPTRFGLATGPVVVGNIGSRSRLAYTVLGDTVNFASRLEGLNKTYGTRLLADETVYIACKHTFAWRRLDQIVVLGKTRARRIYEILGVEGETPEAVVDAAKRYEEAWDLYAARDFRGALVLLDALAAEHPEDEATERLRDLCRGYASEPPGEDWDATTRMSTK